MAQPSVIENRSPIVVLREKLEARENELRDALTDIDPKHFIRTLITAAQRNPAIQTCSFQSLWIACMTACRDNLLPDGIEGAIVPYKDKATWIPMYRGLLKRFRDSGQCKWITANVVRRDELFEHWIDQGGEHFKHVPGTSNGVAPVEQVYAAALTKDGAFYVAVMMMAEINKIKAMSKAAREDSPWRQWPDEMMKKSALRRLSKLLPAGHNVFADDEDEDAPFDDGTPAPKLASMSDVLDRLTTGARSRQATDFEPEDDPKDEADTVDQGEYAPGDDELPLEPEEARRDSRT